MFSTFQRHLSSVTGWQCLAIDPGHSPSLEVGTEVSNNLGDGKPGCVGWVACDVEPGGGDQGDAGWEDLHGGFEVGSFFLGQGTDVGTLTGEFSGFLGCKPSGIYFRLECLALAGAVGWVPR